MALTIQKAIEKQLLEKMPQPEDLKELFSALGSVTESLRRSHDELGNRVKELEGELAKKNRALERKRRLEALGRISAGVAHEIRNPLGSILLYLDLLEKEMGDSEREKEILEKIRKGVLHLSSTVNNMLTFTEPGEAQLVPCDVISLVEESIILATPKARGNLKIVRIFPENERLAHVDPDWLRRILVNIICNACQAMNNNGEIYIKVSFSKELVISIRDTGHGIPENELEQVFLPFWSKSENGTGLGLSIVHSLIERLQGRIELVNYPEGGLEVTLFLPYCSGEDGE